MAAGAHVDVKSENPYHYSFNICAGSSNGSQYLSGGYTEQGHQRSRGESFHGSCYSNYLSSTCESEFHCDLCDRSFRSDAQLKKHVTEHVTCGKSGCQFTAHPKVIANHIRMQHQTGIFNQIKKLDNPEEIKKWIEERKRKYPTQKNIDHQVKMEAAQKKRGETIKPDASRFNKNFSKPRDWKDRRSQVKSRGKRQKHRPMRESLKPNSYHTPVESYEGDGHNGDIPLFRGIGHLEEKEDNEVNMHQTTTDFQISDEDEPVISNITAPNTIQPANKSLALLMASYDSEADSEAEPPSLQPLKVAAYATQPIAACVSDDEPPEEVKTISSTVQPSLDVVETGKRKMPFNQARDQKRQRRHTKAIPAGPDFVRRPRKPTLLQKLLHNQVVQERKVIRDCVRHVVRNNFFYPEGAKPKSITKVVPASLKKPTLLQALLKHEIIHERNIILQCVRHVVSNKYFDSVRIKVESTPEENTCE